jgi:Protein of unknown function (DUF1559)
MLMPIQFTCSCGRKLQAQAEHVGQRATCPACGAERIVPPAEDAVQSAPTRALEPSPIRAAEPRLSRSDGPFSLPQLPTTSRKAKAGLVLGLLSFLLGIFASVPAFFYSARGLSEIHRDPVRVKGRGLALVGIFAAGLGMFLQPMFLLYGVQKVQDRVLRETDAANLRRIGEAMYAYNDEHGHLPPAQITGAHHRPLLSWRVALLPYLGESKLYAEFHFNEPWDSVHNFDLIRRMPKVYAHPAELEGTAEGLTYYRVFVGEDTPFNIPEGARLPDSFIQGVGNSILVATAAEAVPWTKPDELPYDPNKPLPKLGGQLRGGYTVLLADGRAVFLRDGVLSETMLRWCITGCSNEFR